MESKSDDDDDDDDAAAAAAAAAAACNDMATMSQGGDWATARLPEGSG